MLTLPTAAPDPRQPVILAIVEPILNALGTIRTPHYLFCRPLPNRLAILCDTMVNVL